MTENQIRSKVAEAALEYLGCNEADGSHKPIIDLYNSIRPLPQNYRMSYADPWCAAFISAVAMECGLTDIVLPECSCDRMISLYKAKGRWKEADNYSPSIADVVMYDWQDNGSGDNAGGADHVGFVYSRNGNTLTVIEGNISDSVNFRNINVNGRYIRGYCLPDYASKTDTVILPETGAAATVAKVELQLEVLEQGAIGGHVKAAQILLLGRLTGTERLELAMSGGADGEFGKGTRRAVEAYQARNGLTADGIIGRNTWNSLLGI